MKKLPQGKRITFSIPESGINAFCGAKHVHLAPGRFTTTEYDVACFLNSYPSVSLLEINDITRDDNSGLYTPVPDQPRVFNGVISGGGAGFIPIKNRK